MKPRKTAPTAPSTWDDDQPFRVWFFGPFYDEDPRPWKCVAMFTYLQECLDYLDYCRRRADEVVYQSPAELPRRISGAPHARVA